MKKIFVYLFISMPMIQASFAQTVSGTWSGELAVQGIKLPLVLHITQTGDSLSSIMDSPAQGVKGMPVTATAFLKNQLTFSLANAGAAFTGTLQGDSIAGTFTQSGASFPLVLKKQLKEKAYYNRPQTPGAAVKYKAEEVTIVNTQQVDTLAGTFTSPSDKKDFPVVVMITGSGSQNRDEEIVGHKPFLVIADYFTNHGIGVLRMDDRGMGGSSKGKEGATSADFATDINAAVEFLKAKGFNRIGLVGHSEGGMIAPIVAGSNKNVRFIVSMAGPGIPIDELLALQVYAVGKSGGQAEDALQRSGASTNKVSQLIKSYQGADLKAALEKTINEEIDASPEVKNLSPEQKNNLLKSQVAQVSSPWFQYFIRFNPAQYWSRLKIPVLAINGSKDVQVIAKQNLDGIKKSLQQAGNTKFQVTELPGLNHLFQEATTGSPAEYAQIEQTISPAALELMTQWILKQ
jgi:pimeloyl-ACP methyl ester carboxylesterase